LRGFLSVLKKFGSIFYDHLIRPFQETHAPVREVSWGASIGMLIAMTPTVGAQMYIAALFWVIGRYILRFRFNLPIAIAMVCGFGFCTSATLKKPRVKAGFGVGPFGIIEKYRE